MWVACGSCAGCVKPNCENCSHCNKKSKKQVQNIMNSRLYKPTSSLAISLSPSAPPGTSSVTAVLPTDSWSSTTPSSTPQATFSVSLSAPPGPSSAALPTSITATLPPGSSTTALPQSSLADFSFTTPADTSSTLQQVFGEDTEILQVVNLDRGEHIIKLPADQSYLFVPVQPKVVAVEPRKGRKRPPPPPPTSSSFKCEPCDLSFRDRFNLNSHIKRIHGESYKPLECDRFFLFGDIHKSQAEAQPHGKLLLGLP